MFPVDELVLFVELLDDELALLLLLELLPLVLLVAFDALVTFVVFGAVKFCKYKL